MGKICNLSSLAHRRCVGRDRLISWLPRILGSPESMAPLRPSADLRLTSALVIGAAELTWRFSRSSGPGGQNVNTTDSRVELVFDLAASEALPPALQARALQRLEGKLVEGCVVIGGAAAGGDQAAAAAAPGDSAHPRFSAAATGRQEAARCDQGAAGVPSSAGGLSCWRGVPESVQVVRNL
jgi:hypothetical protein